MRGGAYKGLKNGPRKRSRNSLKVGRMNGLHKFRGLKKKVLTESWKMQTITCM